MEESLPSTVTYLPAALGAFFKADTYVHTGHHWPQQQLQEVPSTANTALFKEFEGGYKQWLASSSIREQEENEFLKEETSRQEPHQREHTPLVQRGYSCQNDPPSQLQAEEQTDQALAARQPLTQTHSTQQQHNAHQPYHEAERRKGKGESGSPTQGKFRPAEGHLGQKHGMHLVDPAQQRLLEAERYALTQVGILELRRGSQPSPWVGPGPASGAAARTKPGAF